MAAQAGSEYVTGTRQDAADELSVRLAKFADSLAANGLRPKRLAYGPAFVAGLGKRRSPKGFLLQSSGRRLQLLLPDGRLWQYHERRNIEGIYFDSRTDHARAMHGSIPLDGGRFSFLGAVVCQYHFGYRQTGKDADLPNGFEVGAILGRDATTPQYFTADEAFARIIDSL